MSRDPLRRGILLVLLLACLVILTTADRADPDLWGHVQYGQDLLATGSLPATATHTFTAPDHPWINHEILSEVVVAWTVDRVGPRGLVALKYTLGLAVVLLFVGAAMRVRAGLFTTCLVATMATFNLAPGWSARPQLFTYAFFALMIAILERDSRTEPSTGSARPGVLWTLPVLFAVWANTHGGFVAGWAFLALWTAAASAEARWTGASRAATYTTIVVASALATLVNPYGTRLLVWLARDLAPARHEITEWRALTALDPHAVPFVLLLLLTAAVWVGSGRWRDPKRTLLLIAATWQGFAHVRNIPFFAILAGVWLPGPLEELVRRRRGEGRPASASARGFGAVRAAIGVSAAVLFLVLAIRSRALWVDKSRYPVEAFEYMSRYRLTGKLVAYFDWSQYAIAAFAPDTSVGFDGRFRTCYPQELADLHFDFVLADAVPGGRWRSDRSGPMDGARILEVGRPDLVLLNRRAPHAIRVMEGRDDWVLLYQDGLAQLWGRRSRYDDPASSAYLDPAERSITDRPQSGLVPWPALPARGPGAHPA